MKNNIFLKKDYIIHIEVSIGFKNIYQDFHILKLFESNSIEDRKIDRGLIIPYELKRNIQIVTNYLKLIKSEQIIRENFLYL